MAYQCHDRAPYAINIPMRDSIRVHGLMVTHGTRHVPHAMKKDCQYQYTELGKADNGCNGCKWRDGE